MATEAQSSRSMTVPADQPLIGVFVPNGDHQLVRYFSDEAEADAALGVHVGQHALRVAGAWTDLDYEDAAVELERIRRESRPSNPIEL
jgi:hypothetical protein